MLEWLQRDWPLKVVALVLAFGIWVSITGQGRTLKDFTVPLEIDFGEERIATEPPPTTVTVRLEGSRTSIRQLDQDQLALAVRLDLRDAPTGEREVQFSEGHLDGVPRGVDVSFFNPDRLRLVVDRRAQRKLRVTPELVGEPAEGHSLYLARVTPEVVIVEGPEAALDIISELHTDAIALEEHTRSFVANVNVVPQDPQVSVLTADPLEVRILIDVSPVEVAFDKVPITLRPEGLEAKISPATAQVTVSGPPALLRQLTLRHLSAVAEVADPQSAQRHRVSVLGGVRNLPPGQKGLISVESVHPAQVSVQVSKPIMNGS